MQYIDIRRQIVKKSLSKKWKHGDHDMNHGDHAKKHGRDDGIVEFSGI